MFMQSWWLDAVSPNAWGEVTVEKGGQVHAALPYVVRKRLGLTLLTMPQLTPHLGPWLRPFPGKYVNRLSEEKELLTALIEQLPPYDLFHQRFHPSIANWLPFYWKGFTQSTGYTYILENLSDESKLWAGMRENIRTDIRKAEKVLHVRSDEDLPRFMQVNSLTFQRQSMRTPYSIDFLRRIDSACSSRDCRRMFFAEDGQGRVHAAAYIVWDSNSAYYLMGGGDPALRNSGAMSLALWEAIRFSATVAAKFDFEGSMIEGVERFCRSFGAVQTPYIAVNHMSRRMRVLMAARDVARAMAERPKQGRP